MWFTHGLFCQPPPLASKGNPFQTSKNHCVSVKVICFFFPLPTWEIETISHFIYLIKQFLSNCSLFPAQHDETCKRNCSCRNWPYALSRDVSGFHHWIKDLTRWLSTQILIWHISQVLLSFMTVDYLIKHFYALLCSWASTTLKAIRDTLKKNYSLSSTSMALQKSLGRSVLCINLICGYILNRILRSYFNKLN